MWSSLLTLILGLLIAMPSYASTNTSAPEAGASEAADNASNNSGDQPQGRNIVDEVPGQKENMDEKEQAQNAKCEEIKPRFHQCVQNVLDKVKADAARRGIKNGKSVPEQICPKKDENGAVISDPNAPTAHDLYNHHARAYEIYLQGHKLCREGKISSDQALKTDLPTSSGAGDFIKYNNRDHKNCAQLNPRRSVSIAAKLRGLMEAANQQKARRDRMAPLVTMSTAQMCPDNGSKKQFPSENMQSFAPNEPFEQAPNTSNHPRLQGQNLPPPQELKEVPLSPAEEVDFWNEYDSNAARDDLRRDFHSGYDPSDSNTWDPFDTGKVNNDTSAYWTPPANDQPQQWHTQTIAGGGEAPAENSMNGGTTAPADTPNLTDTSGAGTQPTTTAQNGTPDSYPQSNNPQAEGGYNPNQNPNQQTVADRNLSPVEADPVAPAPSTQIQPGDFASLAGPPEGVQNIAAVDPQLVDPQLIDENRNLERFEHKSKNSSPWVTKEDTQVAEASLLGDDPTKKALNGNSDGSGINGGTRGASGGNMKAAFYKDPTEDYEVKDCDYEECTEEELMAFEKEQEQYAQKDEGFFASMKSSLMKTLGLDDEEEEEETEEDEEEYVQYAKKAKPQQPVYEPSDEVEGWDEDTQQMTAEEKRKRLNEHGMEDPLIAAGLDTQLAEQASETGLENPELAKALFNGYNKSEADPLLESEVMLGADNPTEVLNYDTDHMQLYEQDEKTGTMRPAEVPVQDHPSIPKLPNQAANYQ